MQELRALIILLNCDSCHISGAKDFIAGAPFLVRNHRDCTIRLTRANMVYFKGIFKVFAPYLP